MPTRALVVAKQRPEHVTGGLWIRGQPTVKERISLGRAAAPSGIVCPTQPGDRRFQGIRLQAHFRADNPPPTLTKGVSPCPEAETSDSTSERPHRSGRLPPNLRWLVTAGCCVDAPVTSISG